MIHMPVTVNASYSNNQDGILGVQIKASDPIVKPIEIALLFDTSGSMEGSRLESVKRTLTVLLNRLNPDDKVTLVGFSNLGQTVLDKQMITKENRDDMISKIKSLVAEGGTNLQAGIEQLGSLYKNNKLPNALVVLTDGHINEGITSVGGLYSMIQSYLKNVPVYTLGYGDDHNAGLLKSISSRSCASYTYIQDEIALPTSIGDMLGALQTEVASNATLTYDPSWTCLEPSAEKGDPYKLGSLIADKSMWAIFSVPPEYRDAAVILSFNENSTDKKTLVTVLDGSCDSTEISEQHIRCLIGSILSKITDAMTANKLEDAKTFIAEGLLLLSGSSVSSRPLMIRMKAQLEESLEEVNKVLRTPPRHSRRDAYMTPAPLLNRMTSLGGNYSAQRGVTQMANGQMESLFSSDQQEVTSSAMAEQYREDPI